MAILKNKGSRKIKVLYLINKLSTAGAEMMLYRLLSRLNRNIFDPQVILLISDDGPVRKKIEAIGIPVISIGFKSKLNPIPLFRMYKLIKSASPDIVHTQLFAADILGRIICRLMRIPIVITSIRNSFYGGKFRDLLIRLTEKYATKTTIVSKAAAKRFIDHKVIPTEKLQVIYNGIDTDLFYTNVSQKEKMHRRTLAGLKFDGFLVLAVGRLTGQKGYNYLLEAFRLLAENNDKINLVFAGTGKDEAKLKAEAIKIGLKEKVIFLGQVDDMPNLMAAADMLVSSSLWEGLPGVVMEAMASELPVVATSVGGTPELVKDEVTGYLVSSGSASELADAMEKVIKLSDENRKAMGIAGRKIIEEHYKIELMVAAYEKLYIDAWGTRS